ncbi:MAG: hypothetical protein LBG18_01910 [Mediterranea sp.]|jgi:hypothetical protein|nr:hypothetical protein [Mediterranea sp.]
MKQLILNALKTKFVGVSENILNRMAEKLAKTITKEDDVQAAVDAVTFQQVIDSESDRRATEAQQTAVANYEKKYSIKEGKPVEGGGQGTQTEPEKTPEQGGDIATQIAAAVRAAVSPLMQEIETLKSGKVADTRKQQLDAVIANASDKFKSRIEKSYSRMAFKDEADFNAWLEETKTEAEEDSADTTAQGAVFGRPKVGQQNNNKDEVPKQIQDYLDGKGKAEGQAF